MTPFEARSARRGPKVQIDPESYIRIETIPAPAASRHRIAASEKKRCGCSKKRPIDAGVLSAVLDFHSKSTYIPALSTRGGARELTPTRHSGVEVDLGRRQKTR